MLRSYNSFDRMLLAVLVAASVSVSSALAQTTSAPTLAGEQSIAVSLETILGNPSVAEPALNRAYALRGYRPIWIGPDERPACALFGALARMGVQGLPVPAADISQVRMLLDGPANTWKQPAVEIYLTGLFLSYASSVRNGVTDPSDLSENIMLEAPYHTSFDLLEPLVVVPAAHDYVAALAPVLPEYSVLRGKFEQMQALVVSGGWGEFAIPSGPTLKPGQADPRIISIRDRLALMGDHAPLSQHSIPYIDVLLATVRRENFHYDTELMRAVQRFQRRHGLNDDGLIGDATLAAMNVTAEERLAQVAVNLERLRWRTAPYASRHIYVNLPDFRVHLREGGQTVFETRAVVGEGLEHQTHEFSDTMTFLVANPSWTVPRDIAVEELLPQLQADSSFLVDSDMTLVKAQSVEIPEDVTEIDWFQFSDEYFPFWLRQLPSLANALGQLKFMFPNPYHIYLHDTPHRGHFRRDIRDYSYGCVRLQDPVGLAHAVLASNFTDPEGPTAEDALADILASGVETELPLNRSFPIHLDYRTSWIGEDGTLQFRQDIYGRDVLVFDALRAAGVDLLAEIAPAG